ncbi:MAG: O-antigen ligase family protein, partial [Pseudomonadota bacterium]
MERIGTGPMASGRTTAIRIMDMAFLAVGASVFVLGESIYILLLVLAIPPVIWTGVALIWARADRTALIAAALLMQHGLALWLLGEIHPVPGEAPRDMVDPEIGPQLLMIGPLLVARVVLMRDPAATLRLALPATLVLGFAGLTVNKVLVALGEPTSKTCRIEGLTELTFTPPVYLTIFALIALAAWGRAGRGERGLLIALLGAAVVAGWGYSVSRSIGLVQVALFAALAAWMILRGGMARLGGIVLGTVLAGLVLSWIVDVASGCNLMERFVTAAEIAVGAAPVEADPNISRRLDSAGAGLRQALEAPLAGSGVWAEEPGLSTRMENPLKHAHNQYVSWAVWGGIPMVLSGLGFLLAPAMVIWRMPPG